jgi:hypothetical protein
LLKTNFVGGNPTAITLTHHSNSDRTTDQSLSRDFAHTVNQRYTLLLTPTGKHNGFLTAIPVSRKPEPGIQITPASGSDPGEITHRVTLDPLLGYNEIQNPHSNTSMNLPRLHFLVDVVDEAVPTQLLISLVASHKVFVLKLSQTLAVQITIVDPDDLGT